jgi:hypothetical protein
MKLKTLFIAAILGLMLFTSCASAKQNAWLKAHKEAIAEATSGSSNAEAKLDVVLSRYTILMDEGLKFVNPVKGVKYIGKFQKQNEANISRIVGESSGWMNNLSTEQTVMLGLRVTKKPYIGQFIDLLPKFKRKYEQYRMVSELTGKVVGGLGKVGGLVLKL